MCAFGKKVRQGDHLLINFEVIEADPISRSFVAFYLVSNSRAELHALALSAEFQIP